MAGSFAVQSRQRRQIAAQYVRDLSAGVPSKPDVGLLGWKRSERSDKCWVAGKAEPFLTPVARAQAEPQRNKKILLSPPENPGF